MGPFLKSLNSTGQWLYSSVLILEVTTGADRGHQLLTVHSAKKLKIYMWSIAHVIFLAEHYCSLEIKRLNEKR